jgi:predicted CoA-substrate-specific enzyme activase
LLGLGIDIGSTAVKAALVDEQGRLLGLGSRPLLGAPAGALAELLVELRPADLEARVRVGVTGEGRDLVRGEVLLETEVVSLARGLQHLLPGVRTAIEVGGHGARFLLLDPVSGALLDYGLNQQCAAGSGSFFEQQSGRLELSPEELALLAAEAPRGATVAGRCSVFAKSDMIHLQQKGTPVDEIAYGLCLAMARNFVATVLRGREAPPPVALLGGSAANPGLVRAFGEVLGLPPDALQPSPRPGGEGALGVALGARDDGTLPELPYTALPGELRLLESRVRASTLLPLEPGPGLATAFVAPPGEGPIRAFLGVDVGSVSTNLVLLDEQGELLEGLYLATRGRPIEVLGEGLARLQARFGSRLMVLGVGVTGSGRHLAAGLLGADLVRNEITCQLRGALAVDPAVDTILEIGGQDSKYVQVRDGRIADFVMNKICAAGTGSFLEEQAEHLGLPIVGEFSRQAARSRQPAELGCQCTVFMHSEVVAAQRRGGQLPDLCAGLAYSVARNYLERVVASRPVGQHVLFQGGVANNPAVVAAFSQLLARPVRVHPHAGLSGAIGAALLVAGEAPARSRFRGLGACRDHEIRTFECRACANRCQVSQIRIEGQQVHFGDACERYASRVVTPAGEAGPTAPDFLARWAELESQYFAPPTALRGRIGLPRASAYLDQLPFWSVFFARLGYELVPSRPSSQETLQRGLRRLPAETCLPIKLLFGHVLELADAGVEQIFLPSILNRPGDDPRGSHSCPYVQAVPYMVQAAVDASFLSPEVDLSGGEESFVLSAAPALAELGVNRFDVLWAYRDAHAAWADFRRQLLAAGRQAREQAGATLVIIGKPYNVLDPYLNLNLFAHLRRLGVTALPMWALPYEEAELDVQSARLPWHLNRAIVRAVRYCLQQPGLHPVLVSNFGCGPDAFTSKHLEALLEGHLALTLEFDEHRGEAGLVTRLEAFLDELQGSPARPGVATEPPIAATGVAAIRSAGPGAPPATSFVVPYFSDHAFVFAGALQAAGHQARVLPLPSAEIRKAGEQHVSGKECHPYGLLTADLVHLAQTPRREPTTFFFPGTTVPCLMHQYGDGHRLLLRKLGVTDLTVLNPSFDELKELIGFEIGARLWRGLVAVDLLIKMVCETRPYEREPGQTDEVHRQNLRDIQTALALDELSAALTMATSRLRLIPVDRAVPRPVVGVAGDIFTRINPVGNQDLFLWLEERGCEVWPAPFLVDITDFSLRRDWARGRLGEAALLGAIMLRKNMESWRVHRAFKGQVKRAEEPGYQEVLDLARPYLGRQQNEVLILNVAKMVDFARHGADGILNAVCFNCMLGTVSSAITGRLREDHRGIPIANLVYSTVEGSQRATLEAFLHQVQSFHRRRVATLAAQGEPLQEKGLLARLWPGG